MFKDFAAVHRLSTEIKGKSIHRRGMNSATGRFTDLHIRVPTKLLRDDIFTPHYCQLLGEELSNLDGQLFQGYLSTLFKSTAEATVVGVGNVVRENQVYLVTPEDDGRLFEVLRNTLFSVVLNNFMSKFCLSFTLFIFIVKYCDHVLIFHFQLQIIVHSWVWKASMWSH